MRIAEEILDVLRRADVQGANVVLAGQLDRSLYLKTNDVLLAAGGKWNRSAKAHVFQGDAGDRLDEIIVTGSVEKPKDFDFFPTPEALGREVVALADLQPGMFVFEPNAGDGALVKIISETNYVDAMELVEARAKLIPINDNVRSVVVGDFLTATPHPRYDRAVLNPPFSKQQDILHVLHALKFLKPGGKLVAIMSSSVTFRDNKLTCDFRELIERCGGAITKNEEGAFKSSGTMVSTVTVEIYQECAESPVLHGGEG